MPVSDRKFNNIKIHTQYSICEGAIKIDDLAEYCKVNKIKSIGIADSYNLCGALEFSEKLSKVGTQPIIGTQINLRALSVTGKITLYATSEQGYKNLTKLSSLSDSDPISFFKLFFVLGKRASIGILFLIALSTIWDSLLIVYR